MTTKRDPLDFGDLATAVKRAGSVFPTKPANSSAPDVLSKPAAPKLRKNKVRGQRNTAAKRDSGEVVQLNAWVTPDVKTQFKLETVRRGMTGGDLLLELWNDYKAKGKTAK